MNYPIKTHEGKEQKKAMEKKNNVSKYGFYSEIMLPEEKQELDENLSTNLQGDIDMMTVAMENYLKKMIGNKPRSWDQLQAELRSITSAAIAKATLIRTRASMSKKIRDIADMDKWLKSLDEEE